MNIYKLKKFDIKRIQMNSQSGFLLRFFAFFLHTSMFVVFHTIPGKMVEKIKKINSTFSGAIRSRALNFLRPAFSIFFLRSSFLLLTSYFLITCSTPTSADKTVTFSGTVTLQGATDFSGVTVSLYKPVELDTAITNERVKHSSVGIELTQRTEFFWRVEKAVYTTTTTADGSWEIKAEPGSYNIVAQKDGHGWRVLYEQTNSVKSNISLPVPVTLKGSYFEDLSIPANSFVVIDGRVTFNFTELKIGAGSIVEFRNNGKLETSGPVSFNGAAGNEIMIVPADTSNSSSIKLTQSNNSYFNYICSMYLKNAFYITNSDSIQIKHSRFHNQQSAVEFFSDTRVHVENNIISNMTDGLVSRETSLNLIANIINNNKQNGLKSLSAKNSFIKNNIFKNCKEYGLSINIGGYRYPNTFLYITQNDFKNNKTHIYVGQNGKCKANFNNLLIGNSFSVKTFQRALNDTLNFQNNFWNNNNAAEISNKIYDVNDWQGDNYKGPLIDFSNYLMFYNVWENRR